MELLEFRQLILQEGCLLADTREKKNSHITDYCSSINLSVEKQKFDVGDYGLICPSLGIETPLVLIERKGNMKELVQNLCSKDRKRFESELGRSKDENLSLTLFCEGFTKDNLADGDYQHEPFGSKAHPNSVIGSLEYMRSKYNVGIVYVPQKENSAKMLIELLVKKTYEQYIKNLDQLNSQRKGVAAATG